MALPRPRRVMQDPSLRYAPLLRCAPLPRRAPLPRCAPSCPNRGSKPHKTPPPSRSCGRGRWWWPNRGRKPTAVSLWYTREVVGPERGRNPINIHLRLAFAREGGGGGPNGVETAEKATSVLLLHAREVVGKRVSGGVKMSHNKSRGSLL